MDEGMMALGPDERHSDLRAGLTIISLREGDITEADVEGIVNPANEQLVLGAGVAGAIRERGGPDIQEECSRLGPVQAGEAVITGAGRLRARHVIHAVGPRAGDGNEADTLARATRSALRVATENGLTSLALPAISTGIFGVDKEVCARAMLDSTVAFLEQEKTPLRRIEFCLRGPDTLSTFTAELQRLRNQLESAR